MKEGKYDIYQNHGNWLAGLVTISSSQCIYRKRVCESINVTIKRANTHRDKIKSKLLIACIFITQTINNKNVNQSLTVCTNT